VPPKSPPLPPKKDVLLALLERTSVFIHLDPRRDPVRVPEWFKKQPQLILQVGLNLPVPIRDLHIDDESVSCTLSFSRSPHFCYLPWAAVYAIVGEDGRGMVWPDDVPREVVAQQEAQVRAQKAKRARPKLRAVGTAAERPEEDAETVDDSQAAPSEAAAEPDGSATPSVEPTAEPGAASSPPPDAPAREDGAKRRLPPYLRVVK
jgi:stringent starvation protein B